MKFLEMIVPQLIELVKKYGTKFVVALGGIAAVWHLVSIDKLPGVYGAIAIGAIAVVYFIFRQKQEANGGGNNGS